MYKRVLLKLSGESLGGLEGKGLDTSSLEAYAEEIVSAAKAGLQVAVVNTIIKMPNVKSRYGSAYAIIPKHHHTPEKSQTPHQNHLSPNHQRTPLYVV